MNFLVRLLLWCILLTFPAVSMAQEVGQGLLCDTEAQMRDLIKLANESHDFGASLEKVNNGGNACGVAAVAFIRGETLGEIRTPEGVRDIVKVTVIGVVMPQGLVPVPPMEQVTLFAKQGEAI